MSTAMFLTTPPVASGISRPVGEPSGWTLDPLTESDTGHRGRSRDSDGSRANPDARSASDANEADDFDFAVSAAFSIAHNSCASIVQLAAPQLAGPARLLGHLAVDAAALDQAIADVVGEVDRLSSGVAGWFSDDGLQPWIKGSAAILAAGLGGAVIARHRTKTRSAVETEADSSTWILTQLQHSTGCG